MNNGNNPASPIFDHMGDVFMSESGGLSGLTRREHFAGLAMQGMISSKYFAEFCRETLDCEQAEGVAATAVRYADALLAELEK